MAKVNSRGTCAQEEESKFVIIQPQVRRCAATCASYDFKTGELGDMRHV